MHLGLTWPQAGSVVVSAAGVYLGFLVLFRIAGPRLLGSASTFELAATVALGAIMGRSVLGYTPTLPAGLLGMGTLFALQAIFGLARRRISLLDRALSRGAILLMADGAVLDANLRKAGLQEDELRQRLRLCGVRRYSEVAAAVLERTGAISVLRTGHDIGPELFSDVVGHGLLGHSEVNPTGGPLES